MSKVETFRARPDFTLPRIIKGGWQLADDHSDLHIARETAAKDMFEFVELGITAFDCGDIYLGVEEKIGYFLSEYRRRFGTEAASRIKVTTKFVPHFLEKEKLARIDRRYCEEIIDRSLQRLRQERLDLVEIHWWDYDTPGNTETALILKELQAAGKIHHLGATNYDVPHMRDMIAAGVDLACHQVQYSILDRRPENGMVEFCRENNVHILCYGVLAGGLLSDTWLGIPDPGGPYLENVSLDKYYRIIQDFGGWALFQQLLSVLRQIADKHEVSISNVATRFVLERPQVGAAIIGARNARRAVDTLRAFDFSLDPDDYSLIAAVLAKSTGPSGDCYGIDRLENRDALEEVKAEYFVVEDRKLVRKTRQPPVVDEPYGHHLLVHGDQNK
jgi:aryl-alcohol dehydrogenase-like predicted oxidoreductase